MASGAPGPRSAGHHLGPRAVRLTLDAGHTLATMDAFTMSLRSLLRFIVLLIASAAIPCQAALKLGSPFGDHMVLQQGMPVPVWGWADPGATLTVTFAGQNKGARADAQGAWRVVLEPLTASSESRTFAVVAGESEGRPLERLELKDVLVGEVWICGGQSNMERELGPRAGQKPIIGWEEAAASATLTQLRQYYVVQHTADAPQTATEGGWTVCSPETAHTFTAVGFFFARALQEARGGVPVGILHTSWGGTVAEAWTSREGLAGFPEIIDAIDLAQRARKDFASVQKAYLATLEDWYREHDAGTNERWWTPGLDASAWETTPVPGLWEDAGHPNWDGIAWYHRTFDLPETWAGQDLVLHLAAVDDIDTTWVNGVNVGSTSYYSTQRTYRVPASALKPAGNEITLRVLDTMGGGGIWNPRLKLGLERADGAGETLPLAGPWRVRFVRSLEGLPPPPSAPVVGGPNVPTVLYNAMLAPLAPYAIRGAAFYQGESNASRPAQYRRLLPAMIADWRRVWGQGEFPFLFVQIAPFSGQPPEIREAQLLTWQETQNTAMIVTIDAGDADDIHPANKRPVGERLARAARALAYGEPVTYSGPVYAGAEFGDGRAVVRFTHLAGGLVAPGGRLEGFTLAGADGAFHAGEARIIGDTVVVSSPAVSKPAAVRYGWANVAHGNLFNTAGLPASPFRSDGPE